MNRLKLAIILSVISMITLSVVQSVVSNRLSTYGVLLSKLEREIDYYKTENSILFEKLFSASSLTVIAAKASDLGFVEGKSQFVVTSSLPLAFKQ